MQFTPRNLILDAHRQSGLVSKYDTPDGNQFSEGLRELQKVIAAFNVANLLPFTQDMRTITESQIQIALDTSEFPALDLQRMFEDGVTSFSAPMDIIAVRDTNNKMLRKVSRHDLFSIAKKEKGKPTFFCYDRVGRLYVDVYPNEDLVILFNRKFEISKDELDEVMQGVPEEYAQVFINALAFRLGTANHLPADVLAVLSAKNEESMETVRKANIKTKHMLLWGESDGVFDVMNPANWRIG